MEEGKDPNNESGIVPDISENPPKPVEPVAPVAPVAPVVPVAPVAPAGTGGENQPEKIQNLQCEKVSEPSANVRNEKRKIALIQLNHEPRFKTLKCTFRHCQVGPFKNFNKLVDHCKKFHKSSKFQCSFCGLYLERKRDLVIHEGMLFIMVT